MTTKTSRRCDQCEYFSHAMEQMTDHVDWHSCVFYARKIETIREAVECTKYNPKEKKSG